MFEKFLNLEFVSRERRCRNATHVEFRASDFEFNVGCSEGFR
jgi:hypothetical protein